MIKVSPKIPIYFLLPIVIFCFGLLLIATPVTNIQADVRGPDIFISKKEITIATESQFASKISEERVSIPFEMIFQKDSTLDWGVVKKGQEGIVGEKLITTEIVYWKGDEVDQRIYTKITKEPTNQINLLGTKLTPGVIESQSGKLAYKGKIKMFATSYDKNCPGCDETTATGARLTYGIAAVDPEIIPLGSKIFVPGYGIAVAADTGGAIKGAKIDLAFDNVRTGFWSSRWTEVYLLE